MKSIRFGLILFLLQSCTTTEKPKETSAVDYQTFVATYFEAFNQHQWKAMASMYADTAYFKDPSFGVEPVYQTHADIIEKYRGLQESIPDVRDSVVAVYPSDQNTVTVEFISQGTLPDKTKLYLPICTIFKLNAQGKIIQDLTYYDNQ